MLRAFVADESKSEEVPITRQAFGTPDAMVALGKLAIAALEAYGSCTFIIDEQGQVRHVNPFQIYVPFAIAYPPDGVEPTFVRPILTEKKPQYVAVREDGSIWEVEYRKAESGG